MPNPIFSIVDFRQSCRRSAKIAFDNIVRSDCSEAPSENVVKRFAPTFRQRCQKVTARRRHWGQGSSPASGVLTSKRDACVLTAGGGEALAPPAAGLSFRGRLIFIYRNGNSIFVEAKIAQIPFLVSVMWLIFPMRGKAARRVHI